MCKILISSGEGLRAMYVLLTTLDGRWKEVVTWLIRGFMHLNG